MILIKINGKFYLFNYIMINLIKYFKLKINKLILLLNQINDDKKSDIRILWL